jgi:hypothetical protein
MAQCPMSEQKEEPVTAHPAPAPRQSFFFLVFPVVVKVKGVIHERKAWFLWLDVRPTKPLRYLYLVFGLQVTLPNA